MNRNQQGVVLFLTLLLCLHFFWVASPSRPPHEVSLLPDRPPVANKILEEKVWIEVDGPFKNRGVYAIEKGQRVFDLVAKTGGFHESTEITPESLSAKIDQSGRLSLTAAEEGKRKVILQALEPSKMKVLSLPVNINTAKMEELDILPGIGPKMARAILDYREVHGKFSVFEDLLRVKGIGPKKLAALRPHITLQD